MVRVQFSLTKIIDRTSHKETGMRSASMHQRHTKLPIPQQWAHWVVEAGFCPKVNNGEDQVTMKLNHGWDWGLGA